MKRYCIILWDKIFELKPCRIYNEIGSFMYAGMFEQTIEVIRIQGYTEVPINSKIGRQILAKIGAQKP